jgi:hypothetical protein
MDQVTVRSSDAFLVLRERRERQRDLDRETLVVYAALRGMRDVHTELEVDRNVDYLIEYFKDMNTSSRDLSDGDTLTKGLIIAHKI